MPALPMRVALVAALFAPMLVHSAPPIALAEGTCSVSPQDEAIDAEEYAAIDAINYLRTQKGLQPVSVSGTLTRAAAWKSQWMASGAPVSHDDGFRSWQQRMIDCGYNTNTYMTENLVAGTETAWEAVRMWDASAPHAANMYHGGVRAAGIARAAGGPYGWYWTVDFGGITD